MHLEESVLREFQHGRPGTHGYENGDWQVCMPSLFCLCACLKVCAHVQTRSVRIIYNISPKVS